MSGLRRRQRGQAMVECLVACLALLLFPLGMVMTGRWHDVQMRSIEAARFLAFDALWSRGRNDPARLREDVRANFFTQEGWVDYPATRPLLEPARDVDLQLSETDPPGRVPAVTRFMVEPLHRAGAFLGGEFDLTQRGFYRSRVELRLPDIEYLPAPLDRLGLVFQERTALLGDAWNAAGPDHVARRTSGLMPTTLLGEQDELVSPMLGLLSILEPRIDQLCFGFLDPEIVPADRLAPPLPAARRLLPTGARASC